MRARIIISILAFSACHEGAGIEGLCVSSSFDPPLRGDTYSLNYSSYQGQFINSSLSVNSLQLLSNPASNIGMPLFFPGDNGISVGFDQHDLMYIAGYQDDTVNPPEDLSAPKPYYQWYACTTNWVGYVYQTLA
ncbi:uncharacterized protein PAC_14729 [Phialocephala subalpina]|uniref:Uncharacterized protein n=1 Tax=Phialocephala subalpina TaxID=576137 RepID=A0A1L7XIG8_9HELO|nr:uncharacterized protein PAC_14729 [Phialocephala subalpina]